MTKKESWFSLPVRLSEEVDRLFDELSTGLGVSAALGKRVFW